MERVTTGGSLQVSGSVSAVSKKRDGTATGLGNQHLDSYRQIALGFDLTKQTIVSSSESDSSDTGSREAWIGEVIDYRITAKWFGAEDLGGSNLTIDTITLTDNYPNQGVVTNNGGGTDTGSGGEVTWSLADITGGSLTVTRDISVRVDESRSPSSANGTRFRNIASASFRFQGETFDDSSTKWLPANESPSNRS